MTTTLCPDEAIALHSESGEHWHDPHAEDGQRPLTWEPSDAVTKIVIGAPPIGDEEKEISVAIPGNLAEFYPNLTHLHLWQIGNLEQLTELPCALRSLDVRGCKRLVSLPGVPDSLEELDLGGCSALAGLCNATPSLLRLYVNDCTALEEDFLIEFWLDLARRQPEPRLVVFDGSRCPAVTSIRRIPRSVTRLVLEGCENLRSAEQLEEFRELRRLNLSSCGKLEQIPAIPDHLQYVQLHGSEQLRRFMGQDIGPYDRGTGERPNVAKTLYSRRKFGSELTASAHAKLLLLGSGRVGKSTLAKRLQWDCLTPDQQADPQYAHLRPQEGEPFTHKIRFHAWQTRLQLDEQAAAEVNKQAEGAGLEKPCSADHTLEGFIRIWDFGGQEIYHQTHRLFAAEGSVFLILWTAQPLDQEKLRAEKPRNLAISDEEWEEWNRTHSLDYWLDYVRSIRPGARTALVCTRVPKDQDKPAWTNLAPKHKDDDLQCFYIDSLEDACPDNPEYRKLVDFVRRACGAEAKRVGIVQPAYYSQVAEHVNRLLAQNDADREHERQPEHLLVPDAKWHDDLVQQHREAGDSRYELDADDIGTITGYLHDAGSIFHLRDPSHPAVLIDQGWATDLIYQMLHPSFGSSSLFNQIRKAGGYFDKSLLELDRHWRQLDSDAERDQILAYMEQCAIIVRVLEARQSRDGKDHYLATEKWLLPEYAGKLQRQCEDAFERVRDQEGASVIQHFSFEAQRISEFDFRALMAHLGGVLGTRAKWFRNGIQAVDDWENPSWCFQVRWPAKGTDKREPAEDSDYLRPLDARLIAPERRLERLSKRVERVFAADGSPLARDIEQLRREAVEPDELSYVYFRDITDSDYDLAVSSSGADREVVQPLVDALRADGLRVAWYELQECRAGERAEVMKFMKSLRNPPCILLFLSDGYFADDPETNWYCIWELADSILQVQKGQRPIEQTLVAYRRGGQLKSGNVDRVAADVMTSMAAYFRDLFADLWRQDRQNRKTFDYYDEWSRKFADAADHIGDFFTQRGTQGAYSRYQEVSDGEYDFSGIVRDVRSALGLAQGAGRRAGSGHSA